MTAATVSVIIPTWNRAHTLGDAIESALAQDHPPLEVLVCDDGSSDGSEALVARLGDPRVRFLAGAHSGRPAVARNRGIRASRADWLAFLDSDDKWLPGKLSTQLALSERLGCLAACSNATRVVPGLAARGNLLAHRPARLGFRALLRDNLVVCSSVVFHRSLLRQVHGFPEDAALIAIEDYALWLRIATLTDFAFVDRPLVAYTDDLDQSIRGRHRRDVHTQRLAVFRSYRAWAPPLAWRTLAVRLHAARARTGRLKQRALGR